MKDTLEKKTYMRPTNMKKCLSSLAIKEMQIKTTLRYHLMPVRMAIIKKSGDIWEAKVGGSRGQEIETILGNMAKPRLY